MGPGYLRVDGQDLANGAQKAIVDQRQEFLIRREVQSFECLPVGLKVSGSRIAVNDRLPVSFGPTGIADHRFFYLLEVVTFDGHRYG